MEQLLKVFNGDIFLFSFLSTKGKIGYIDAISAAYRMNDSGVYSNLDYFNRLRNRLHTFKTLQGSIPAEYHNYLIKGYCTTLQRLFVISWCDFKILRGLKYLCYLILIDIRTRDINGLRAIRLFFRSILYPHKTVTD
jgi:hypothetical protein